MRRVAGLALLGLLAVHPWLRPEGGWALLSACDLAAFATAVGLIAGVDRVVATAFVFQVAVGLPALAIGMLTTYRWNSTGVALHLIPILLGGVVVADHGVPPRAALFAWLGYAASLVVATLVVPEQLNINFSSQVWAPMADAFSLRAYQAFLLVLVGGLLAAGSLMIRRLVALRAGRARRAA